MRRIPHPRLITAHWPLWAVCALFALTAALTLGDYGVREDEPYQRAIGNAALDYLAGDGERALDQVRVPADRYYGAAFEAPLALAERILGLEHQQDAYLSRHLLTHLFFLAGGVFCYLLVLRMFNNRALALIATVLFLLHPRIYAHSFYNSKDVPFLAAFMVSLSLTHRAFRRDTLAAFLLCGVPAGNGDLPEHRKEYGFDNLDFTLATHGARLDGNCVAVVPLPAYPIATVRTGQYDDTGALWTAEFAIPGGE